MSEDKKTIDSTYILNEERASKLSAAIEQANQEIKTIPVKDKPYAQVHERIKAFRKVYPDGGIATEILQNDDKIIAIKATIWDRSYDMPYQPLATGMAFEFKNGSNINKTSWLENCETSAVGRALGFAWFGIDTAIASAEELTSAEIELDRIKTEELRKTPIGLERAVALNEALLKADVNIEKLCEQYKVNELAELTEEQLRAINAGLNKAKKGKS